MCQRQTAAQPNETAIIVGGGLGGLMMAIRLQMRVLCGGRLSGA